MICIGHLLDGGRPPTSPQGLHLSKLQVPNIQTHTSLLTAVDHRLTWEYTVSNSSKNLSLTRMESANSASWSFSLTSCSQELYRALLFWLTSLCWADSVSKHDRVLSTCVHMALFYVCVCLCLCASSLFLCVHLRSVHLRALVRVRLSCLRHWLCLRADGCFPLSIISDARNGLHLDT